MATSDPTDHPDHVVLGTFTASVVLEVARRSGALDRAGLAVTEVPVTSSPAQFRSLIDGELHVALTSPDNVLAYRFDAENPLGERAAASIVAAVDRGLGLGVWARPGTGVDQLRGARVGVDVPASGFAMALYSLLEGLGLRRDEYDVVRLGSTPTRLRELLSGGCDATMLGAGNELVAEAHGCVPLATVRDSLTPYLGTVVAVVGTAYLDVARRLADVLLATGRDVVDGTLTDEAVAAAGDRLDLEPALARRYVEGLADPAQGLVPDGSVDPAALRTVVELRRRWLPAEDGHDPLADALTDPGLVVDR